MIVMSYLLQHFVAFSLSDRISSSSVLYPRNHKIEDSPLIVIKAVKYISCLYPKIDQSAGLPLPINKPCCISFNRLQGKVIQSFLEYFSIFFNQRSTCGTMCQSYFLSRYDFLQEYVNYITQEIYKTIYISVDNIIGCQES